MNPNLDLLIKIQEVDARLDELIAQRNALPRQIDDLEEKKQAAKIRLAEAGNEHQEVGKRRRKKERDLEIAEEKVAKLKTQLHQIKTNREYQAMLHEIEQGEKEKGALEEEILFMMEEVAAGDVRIKELEEQVKTEQVKIEAAIGEVRRNIAEVERQIEVEEKLKRELLSQTEEGAYRTYQRVRQHRGSVAVCAIRDAICQGCHMSVPRQVYVEVKKGVEIHQCPTCHRILFWPGEEAQE